MPADSDILTSLGERQEVEEMDVPVIGSELGVLPNTIHKAIRAGRLK
jgi:hypothetical protein